MRIRKLRERHTPPARVVRKTKTYTVPEKISPVHIIKIGR